MAQDQRGTRNAKSSVDDVITCQSAGHSSNTVGTALVDHWNSRDERLQRDASPVDVPRQAEQPQVVVQPAVKRRASVAQKLSTSHHNFACSVGDYTTTAAPSVSMHQFGHTQRDMYYSWR